MWWQMKVTAVITVTSTFDKIHADSDMVVSIHCHTIRRMCITTFRLASSADPSLIFTAHLK
jgi:hypothetical protein